MLRGGGGGGGGTVIVTMTLSIGYFPKAGTYLRDLWDAPIITLGFVRDATYNHQGQSPR